MRDWILISILLITVVVFVTYEVKPANVDVPFKENLIAFYKFDGNAQDYMGWHDGIVYGANFVKLDSIEAVNFSEEDYIYAGNNWFPIGNLTITAWIYPKSWGGENKGRIISSRAGQKFFLDGDSDDYNLAFTSSDDLRAHSGKFFDYLNTWSHVTVRRTDNYIEFFINGIQSDGDDPVSGEPIRGTSIFIGNSNTKTKGFHGYIDNLMIFDKALTYEEIIEVIDYTKI